MGRLIRSPCCAMFVFAESKVTSTLRFPSCFPSGRVEPLWKALTYIVLKRLNYYPILNSLENIKRLGRLGWEKDFVFQKVCYC